MGKNRVKDKEQDREIAASETVTSLGMPISPTETLAKTTMHGTLP